MSGRPRSFVAFLRSRRLAVWLLVGITLYAWLATLIPQGAADSSEVAAWDARYAAVASLVRALGLHAAYTMPVFLLAALLLVASTLACAWERTRDAIREFRNRGRIPRRVETRLIERPDFRQEIRGDADWPTVQDAVETALRRVGLAARRGPVVIEGRAHHAGLFGSPLFHWALALLFVVVALGQLTKFEGGVNLLVGTPKVDAEESYVPDFVRGPLFLDRFTGVEIVAEELDVAHEVGGVDRGEATLLSVRDRDGRTRTQWTYANSPLRVGALTIHQTKRWGAALVASVTAEADNSSQRAELLFDIDSEVAGGVVPNELEYAASSGERFVVRMEAREGRRVAVSTRRGSRGDGGSEFSSQQIVGIGEPAELPGELMFTPLEFTPWTQVTLVNDWSIPFVYALFVLACASLPLSVFWPPRAVWVMYREADASVGSPAALSVAVNARRSDPAFAGRVQGALEAALAPAGPDKEWT